MKNEKEKTDTNHYRVIDISYSPYTIDSTFDSYSITIPKMRFATKEEQESIDNFIKEISKPTGINFFEQIDNYNCEKCKYPLMNPLCGIIGNNIKPCGRKSNEL